MPLVETRTWKENAQFMKRTALIYEEQRDRAWKHGLFINYRLEDLRGLIDKSLGEKGCCYCGACLNGSDFRVVLKNPAERGGAYHLGNLAVCCTTCRRAKGNLDDAEFKELYAILRTWPQQIADHLLQRLGKEVKG